MIVRPAPRAALTLPILLLGAAPPTAAVGPERALSSNAGRAGAWAGEPSVQAPLCCQSGPLGSLYGSQYVRGRAAAGRRGVPAHRRVDRPARRRVGRGADHPAVAAARRRRGLPDAARPLARHLASASPASAQVFDAGRRRGRARARGSSCYAKPEWYAPRGAAVAAGHGDPAGRDRGAARPAGAAEEVARGEGLFALDRKQPLPFLPQLIGLVTGRASAAERDVLENARLRWPAVRFEVRNVRRAGRARGAAGRSRRVRELDAHAGGRRDHRGARRRQRGGPAAVLRRAAGAGGRALPHARSSRAIGHEPDSPLLDLVADLRASTPTDAAKRVVPDVGEELARVRQLQRPGAAGACRGLLDREERGLDAALSRPVDGARRTGWSTSGRRRCDALLDRGPAHAAASAGPGGRRAGAHPRPGGGPVPRGDAASAATRCCSGRTARWSGARPRSRRGRRCGRGSPRASSPSGHRRRSGRGMA